jgi:IS5 family transposase
MYEERDKRPRFDTFYLPWGGHLDGENRWVQLERLIPWDDVEQKYRSHFKQKKGRKAKNVRVALGALLIKEKLRLTDEETAEQVRENPYLQYFLGYDGYEYVYRFEASMMVHFRKRLGPGAINGINEIVAVHYQRSKEEREKAKQEQKEKADKDDKAAGSGNHGQLLIDATCAPQDIRHPHDVTLLSEAREKLEGMIDTLCEAAPQKPKKPRTYRRRARAQYLDFIRGRRRTTQEIRRALRKQLCYVRRDLAHVEKLIRKYGIGALGSKQKRDYDVIKKIYEQQRYLYTNKTHSVPHKIISIAQDHVRPIARGKARCSFEFGAKLSVSVTDGRMIFIDRLEWDQYNECNDLKMQVERYKKRFGHYPESVHADKIYRTRDNRNWCNGKHIRLSGSPPGRPIARTGENRAMIRKLKKQLKKDDAIRQAVESVFGVGKRRYGMGLIKEKTKQTSEVSINVCVLLMNLERILRDLFLRLYGLAFGGLYFGFIGTLAKDSMRKKRAGSYGILVFA